MLGRRGQEACGGPTRPIRLFGEASPEGLDCRQPQPVQHNAEGSSLTA